MTGTYTSSLEQRLFSNADAFHRSASLLYYPSDDAFMTYGIPAFTLFSFSLELYLKCVIVIATNRATKGHRLYELYKQLDRAHQQRLKELYAISVAPGLSKRQLFRDALRREGANVPDPTDLEAVLKASTDAFTALRYIHEGQGQEGRATFLAGAVLSAIRELIFELRPEWREPEPNRPLSNDS